MSDTLLDQVEMRFAVANTREKFEYQVKSLIPAVLNSLNNENKMKVVKIHTHVINRMKSLGKSSEESSEKPIEVPMGQLIQVLKTKESNRVLIETMITQYIELGFCLVDELEQIFEYLNQLDSKRKFLKKYLNMLMDKDAAGPEANVLSLGTKLLKFMTESLLKDDIEFGSNMSSSEKMAKLFPHFKDANHDKWLNWVLMAVLYSNCTASTLSLPSKPNDPMNYDTMSYFLSLYLEHSPVRKAKFKILLLEAFRDCMKGTNYSATEKDSLGFKILKVIFDSVLGIVVSDSNTNNTMNSAKTSPTTPKMRLAGLELALELLKYCHEYLEVKVPYAQFSIPEKDYLISASSQNLRWWIFSGMLRLIYGNDYGYEEDSLPLLRLEFLGESSQSLRNIQGYHQVMVGSRLLVYRCFGLLLKMMDDTEIPGSWSQFFRGQRFPQNSYIIGKIMRSLLNQIFCIDSYLDGCSLKISIEGDKTELAELARELIGCVMELSSQDSHYKSAISQIVVDYIPYCMLKQSRYLRLGLLAKLARKNGMSCGKIVEDKSRILELIPCITGLALSSGLLFPTSSHQSNSIDRECKEECADWFAALVLDASVNEEFTSVVRMLQDYFYPSQRLPNGGVIDSNDSEKINPSIWPSNQFSEDDPSVFDDTNIKTTESKNFIFIDSSFSIETSLQVPVVFLGIWTRVLWIYLIKEVPNYGKGQISEWINETFGGSNGSDKKAFQSQIFDSPLINYVLYGSSWNSTRASQALASAAIVDRQMSSSCKQALREMISKSFGKLQSPGELDYIMDVDYTGTDSPRKQHASSASPQALPDEMIVISSTRDLALFEYLKYLRICIVSSEWVAGERFDGSHPRQVNTNPVVSAEVTFSIKYNAARQFRDLISLLPINLLASYSRPHAGWLTRCATDRRRISEWLDEASYRMELARILGTMVASEFSSSSEGEVSLDILDKLVIASSREANDQLSSPTSSYVLDNSTRYTSQYPESKYGAICALAAIIGKCSLRFGEDKMYSIFQKSPNFEKIVDWAFEFLVKKGLLRYFESYEGYLGAQNIIEFQTCCNAFSEMVRFGGLPEKYNEDLNVVREKLQNILAQNLSGTVSQKSSNSLKLVQIALDTLADLCLGYPDAYSKQVAESLFKMADSLSKEPDSLFSMGETLTIVVGGWDSSCVSHHLDYQNVDGSMILPVSYGSSPQILESVLDERLLAVKNLSPANRKPVCIWLLSITNFLGRTNAVKARLSRIQFAFQVLLTDKDELVQEIASKGIGLVYSLGDRNLKEELVRNLLGSFGADWNGKSKSSSANNPYSGGEVEADSLLFDMNSMGNTPDGSTITTYKELCSLATELNQPDLVYKFMSLASSNQIWNSRKGAAFGITEILSQAKVDLEPMLPKLIPKLYRYSFDPNSKVSQSMKNIWACLVSDPNKTLDKYFETIIVDLLEGVVDRMWRIRESSCVALADLIKGRESSQLQPHLEFLWSRCFRAIDDIKESVRVAAFQYFRSLASVTMKFCDPENVSDEVGRKTLAIIIPYMLDKGLGSSAEDVRKFSLTTILSLCDRSRHLIRPHVAAVVPALIERMSELEPQVMNYLSFHAESYNLSAADLESTRASTAKMSPILEIVDKCINFSDEKVFQDLTPEILTLIRKGVGIPTRTGISRLLSTFCIKKPNIMASNQKSCDQIIKALSGAIKDRSLALRTSFSVSLGYIVRFCSEDSTEKLVNHLKSSYCAHTEIENRSGSCLAFNEISKHSNDCIKQFDEKILPVAFFGCRDHEESVAKIWNDVWENNVGSTRNAVSKYLPQLIDLVGENISSNSWDIKKQAAMTLADMAKSIKSELAPQLDAVLSLLLAALSGRSYPGKERILEALYLTCSSCKEKLVTSGKLVSIKETFLKEAARKNKAYQRHSIEYLGLFLKEFPSINALEETIKAIDFFLLYTDYDPKKAEEEDSSLTKPLFFGIRANSMKTLGMALYENPKIADYEKVFSALSENLSDASSPWNVRLGVLDGFDAAVKRINSICLGSDANESTITKKVLDSFCEALKDIKYSNIRERTASVAYEYLSVLKSHDKLSSALKEEFFSKIRQLKTSERQPAIVSQLDKILRL